MVGHQKLVYKEVYTQPTTLLLHFFYRKLMVTEVAECQKLPNHRSPKVTKVPAT